MKSTLIAILSFIAISQLSIAQKTADDMRHDRLPEKFIKPAKWIYADTVPMVWEDFYCNDVIVKDLSLLKAFAIIDKDKSFCNLYSALIWCRSNYRDAFPELIKRLTDTTTVGLEHYIDLSVGGREEFNKGNPGSTGQKPGIVVNEDIFTIAGRASWILNSITGENFSCVKNINSTESLKKIQQEWQIWIKELKRL
jgi:hypothetical protein